jgi:hypothetical protein
MRDLGATVLALVLLAACSTTHRRPPHAGTLIVHAVFAAGPVGPNITNVQGPIADTRVRIRATDGVTTTVTTDDHGDAKFVVASGVYVAQLADVMEFDGKGGSLDCGGGAYPEKVRVPSDGIARATLACDGVG